MKKYFRFLNGRLFYTILLLFLQGLILWGLIIWASLYWPFQLLFSIASFVMVIWLLNRDENPSYKQLWLLVILTLPTFGILLYWFFGKRDPGTSIYKRVRHETYKGLFDRVETDGEVMANLRKCSQAAARQAEFITNTSGLALYQNTETDFFCPGEKFFACILRELKQAKKTIFIEFFTIKEGILWDSILKVLTEKVHEGVDVRVMYDDMGTIKTLPAKYDKKLESLGIRCVVFNRMVPALSIRHNNRNHRKICIIDGHTGFTGGVNISDEYSNIVQPYGIWVDSGIRLRGDGVKNLLVTFLATWNFLRKTEDGPEQFTDSSRRFEQDGFVLPYTDDPFVVENVGWGAYVGMILKARRYVYINTPYFIVDHAMHRALEMAALSGVDVRICFPGIPDKKFTYMLSQSYFPPLIKAGVKIYIFTKGFVHSKTFVSDDETAIVGTINLDYRSLFLDFEDAVWMYGSKAVMQVKEDFLLRQQECRAMTAEEINGRHWFTKLLCAIMKPFAPFF